MSKKVSVLKALKKLYEEGLDYIQYDVIDDISANCLTDNIGRSGRIVLWYNDNNHEVAIYIDTLEFLSSEEIEEEFCWYSPPLEGRQKERR